MNGLIFVPHFGVACSCGEACMTQVTPEQLPVAQADPVAMFRLLSSDDQQACLAFWDKHEGMGHTVEPTLCELAPLGKEGST